MSNPFNFLSEESFVAKMNAQNALLQQIASGMTASTPYVYMTVDEYLGITPITG